MNRFALRMALIASSAFAFSGCSTSPTEHAAPGSSGGPASGASGSDQSASTVGHVGFIRPALEVRNGQYFTWAMPADWKATETANGVDMTSADGRMIASSVLLVGSQGRSDPWSFVSSVLTHLGASDVKRLSTKDLPPQRSGYPGIDWEIQDFEVTFTDTSGSARHADCTCGICNAYGGYSAIIESFSTPPDDYDQSATWLPLLVQSVHATDPGKIAYQNNIIPVRNHPLDNSALMESWKEKRLSQDRIAKAQHEGMMGYERMVSPSTGKYFNMPMETYDGTVGGYHNPDHFNEILKPTQPGE